ncbi:MAG TPA: hypothetical protein VF316_18955 [Polyangiaceae bacterium]
MCILACAKRPPPDPAHEAPSAPPAVSVTPATSTVAIPATTALPVASAPQAVPDAACVPPLRVDPKTLTAQWPSMLGKRVSFAAHIDRALDVTESIVVAHGERFVVLLAPDQAWQGEATKTFIVMGSARVKLGGTTTLPQLVLDTDAACSP